MKKPKRGQSKTPEVQQDRDCFSTPNYAVDLLFPFISRYPNQIQTIWECAAGDGRIVRRLESAGYKVLATDIIENKRRGISYGNFLGDIGNVRADMIVTNPPYSLKIEFYKRCLALGGAWALLIPFDMTGWMFDAFSRDHCQGIVPNRRIDFITPNVLDRIEKKIGRRYKRIDDVPSELLAKFSTSQFHSFWLTHGLNLPEQFMWVELSGESKKDNV